jgi:hypothetical protein
MLIKLQRIFLWQLLIAFGAFPMALKAQFNTPVIDNVLSGNEYGTANANNYVSGGQTWYLTWNADTLYVMVRNANIYEGVFMYFDFDPVVPVNGGGNGNGNLAGFFYENLTPNLPFRSDAFLYIRNNSPTTTFGIIGRANGTGGWIGVGANANALAGGVNDVNEGFIALGNVAGEDRREFKIAWSRIKGSAGVPASFNWFGYCAYNCGGSCGGIYGQVPVANPSGTLTVGATPNMVRYFTVSTTANGTATNPMSRDSYTHLGGGIASFGDINCYDFTMNTPGQTITRLTGPGFKDWNINGTLVVNAGQIYFGAFNAAYGVTDYGNTTINNLIISGGELNFDYSTTTTVVTGNLSLTGGLFYLGDRTFPNHGDLELRGNWLQTTGFFGINHKAVFFRGTTLQTISGNGTLFPYVEINNPAGVTITGGNHTIQDSLWLTNGMLTLGNFNLSIMGLNGQTATSTGGIVYNNTNSFIVTNGTGILRQSQLGPAGRTGAILYPIGNSSSSFRPVTITNTGTADDLAARVFQNVFTGGTQGNGAILTSDYVDRTWAISELINGGSNLLLNFQYDGADELTSFNRNLCAVAYHNGTSWVSTQAVGPVAGSNPYTRANALLTATGNFTISSALIPLPVELLSFTAKKIDNNGYLKWTTSNEVNADYFSLEKSVDGFKFKEIAQQQCQSGNGNKSYMYIDYNLASSGVSILYYRLKQVDKNGSYTYSKIVSIKLDNDDTFKCLAIYPNPCTDFFNVRLYSDKNQEIITAILTSEGKLIQSQKQNVVSGINELKQDVKALSVGSYIFKITAGEKQYSYRFIKH